MPVWHAPMAVLQSRIWSATVRLSWDTSAASRNTLEIPQSSTRIPFSFQAMMTHEPKMRTKQEHF
jgi:hypothetical protein